MHSEAPHVNRGYSNIVSNLEIVAVLLGLINVALIIYRSVWNYPFGIAMVVLYFFIFWDIKLYSDAGLQVFFSGVQFYGWWSWRNSKAKAGDIIVERLGFTQTLMGIAISLFATLIWGLIMTRYTDASHPYWDGAIAMLSVVAQILLTRRFLENWWWWIGINMISIPLYIIKGLHLTAGLYGVFLVLAIIGFIQWSKVYKAQ